MEGGKKERGKGERDRGNKQKNMETESVFFSRSLKNLFVALTETFTCVLLKGRLHKKLNSTSRIQPSVVSAVSKRKRARKVISQNFPQFYLGWLVVYLFWLVGWLVFGQIPPISGISDKLCQPCGETTFGMILQSVS